MVTIKEIAIRCGVSISTVSKALNNKSDVSKEKKEKIIKEAEKMGYMANYMARSLRTKRTHNIGIILDNIDQSFSHSFFSNVLEGFKSEVEKSGYDITFISNEIGGKKISYKSHCEYRNFDGVVIISAKFDSKEILDLVDSDIPVVTIDHIFENCSSVISDNTKGMSELVEYAIKMGHKKIAYIYGDNTKVTRDRITGFYATMRKYNLEIPQEYMLESNYRDTVLTEKRTKELLNLKDPPTCIIFPDDYASISAIKNVDLNNMNISFMGYDGIDIASKFDLTTYEQDKLKLGMLAAKKLINSIENPNSVIEHLVVFGKVRKGSSVKNINNN